MTQPVVALLSPERSSAREARDVVAGRGGPQRVRTFLTGAGPEQVRDALAHLLPGVPASEVRLRLLRAKVKPGRSLTAYLAVDVDGLATGPRLAAVAWHGAAGRAAAVSAQEAEAQRRGLVAPFTGLHADADGMHLLLAPLDPAFPQLVRVHDPRHLAVVLAGGAAGGRRPNPPPDVVRYRPGQRHVLRVPAPSGRVVYAKAYRDLTGARALRQARRFASALSAAGSPARMAEPLGYVTTDRLAVWAGASGQPLSRVVTGRPELARAAGAALHALHGADPGPHRAPGTDPAAQVVTTVRAAEHITALRPATGRRLAGLLAAVADRLAAEPVGPPRSLHGDYKGDNLLVDGDSLRVLDVDRATTGDPALDVGKLAADLRWWAGDAGDAGCLVAALAEGYAAAGASAGVDPGLERRAACYDVLFQLRAAARRVPVHDPSWAEQVDARVEAAAALGRAALGRAAGGGAGR